MRVNHFLLNLKIKTFLDILHTGMTVNFKTFFLLSHHPFYFLVRQQKIRFRLRKKVFVMLQFLLRSAADKCSFSWFRDNGDQLDKVPSEKDHNVELAKIKT